jgi:predicted DNA-binding transcriptional regulator AlpA
MTRIPPIRGSAQSEAIKALNEKLKASGSLRDAIVKKYPNALPFVTFGEIADYYGGRSLSINQWCEMHSVSRSFYYKLAKQGIGPRTFKIGASTRISEKANADYIAAREAVTS